MIINNEIHFSKGLEAATGKIRIKLSNDMALHSAVQNNNHILHGLITSLLGVDEKDVKSITLDNPIDYRKYIDKEIIFDIKVTFNDNRVIEVELQMAMTTDSLWWHNRSILYLCRLFDNLGSGEDYDKIKPATQISIVPKDIFSDAPPEFYAKYGLVNLSNGHVYSSNFNLNVLYLNHINSATEEDKKCNLQYWARAFMSETWDDLKALAKEFPIGKEVAEYMYEFNADKEQAYIAEQHQKYIMDLTSSRNEVKRMKAALDAALEERDNAFSERDTAVSERNTAVSERNTAVSELEALKAKYKKLEETILTQN